MARMIALLLALAAAQRLETWQGVDMGQLLADAARPFRASPSAPVASPFAVLRDAGVNAFRMRMWNDPCADGLCDAAEYDYAGLDGVLAVARQLRAHNLSLILDLHYSDWWADPGQQRKPRAWRNLTSLDALAAAVRAFTHDTVTALVAQGTPPVAVQVGNEVTHGMLFNGASSAKCAASDWDWCDDDCATSGRLWCDGEEGASWARFARLVAAGVAGSRAACPACAVAVHTDLGQHVRGGAGIDEVVAWYRTLARHLAGHVRGAPFDAIGLSMYPKYDGGATLRSAAALGPLAAAFPAATVYIAETSYPAGGAARPQDLVGFPPSPAGQLAYVHALRATLREALPAAQNGGFLWWEETEGADDSLFDAHYVARPALRHGFATPSRRHGEN